MSEVYAMTKRATEILIEIKTDIAAIKQHLVALNGKVAENRNFILCTCPKRYEEITDFKIQVEKYIARDKIISRIISFIGGASFIAFITMAVKMFFS